MNAVGGLWSGGALIACSSGIRLSRSQKNVADIAVVWRRGEGGGVQLRVSATAADEATDSSWDAVPAATDKLLQQLGIDDSKLHTTPGQADFNQPRHSSSDVGQLQGVQPGYVGLFVRLLGADNPPEKRNEAVQALWRHASKGVENVGEIVEYPGCLNLVVSLLTSDRWETAEAAARLLRHVSEVNSHRSLVAECGAIEEIAGLLTRRAVPDEVTEQVLCVLWNMSVEEQWRNVVTKLGLVPVLLALLDSEQVVAREAAAGVLSNLALTEENHDILVKAGSIGKFARLLQKDLSETSKITRQEARNFLFEISRDHHYRSAIIEQGLVPVPLIGASAYQSFKPLLGVTPSVPENVTLKESVEQNTVFGAGKLLLGLKIGDDGYDIDEETRSAREGIVRQQFLARIGVLEREKPGRMKQEPAPSDTRYTFMPLWDGLPRLILILGLEDPKVSQRAAESIAEIATSDQNRELLHNAGATPHLVRMLGCGDESATEAAVTALDKLAVSPKIRKSIDAHGAVEALVAILKANSSSKSLNEKAAGALANLSDAGDFVTESLVEGTIPGLVQIGRSQDAPAEIKVEVEDIIGEMSSRKSDVRSKIIAAGGIPPLVALVSSGTPSQALKATSLLEILAVNEANALAISSSGIGDAFRESLETHLERDSTGTRVRFRGEDTRLFLVAASRLLARLVAYESAADKPKFVELRRKLNEVLETDLHEDWLTPM